MFLENYCLPKYKSVKKLRKISLGTLILDTQSTYLRVYLRLIGVPFKKYLEKYLIVIYILVSTSYILGSVHCKVFCDPL